MARLRHHYYCETCDGTWFAEAAAAVEADCRFCGARDVLPYKSDRGRIGRAKLQAKLAVVQGAKKAKAPAHPGSLKRSA
jgi:hypothetical protein